jgi:hypothetical protein
MTGEEPNTGVVWLIQLAQLFGDVVQIEDSLKMVTSGTSLVITPSI